MSNTNQQTNNAIVNCRLAITDEHSDNTKGITNVLKAAFREFISEGFLFDFKIENENSFKKIKSESELEEGDIFDLHMMFMVLIRDTKSNEKWVKIETCTDLEHLEQTELKKVLKDKVDINESDKIFVTNISNCEHVII